ncbi:phage virion morphogenesis protein [Paraburkholderia sp. A1RI_3L]|uniref:phage virion morphogenesis protein n=1 Tax=Paraburkholderia TaxID=1822464 RepID=UPI003B809BBC
MDELSAVETWAGALLGQLSPAGRRTVMRDVARELRRSQQKRIAAQRNPDGSAYEPRKAKPTQKKAKGRDKRGRIRRTAMFMKLRTARLMKVDAEADGFAVGFAGRVGRIARIHQGGERVPVTPGGPKYRYPARALLGFTDTDRAIILDWLTTTLRVGSATRRG